MEKSVSFGRNEDGSYLELSPHIIRRGQKTHPIVNVSAVLAHPLSLPVLGFFLCPRRCRLFVPKHIERRRARGRRSTRRDLGHPAHRWDSLEGRAARREEETEGQK